MSDPGSAPGGGLVAGDRIGPYAIVAPLGRGGMGEVYRARDDRFGRDVAIKILPGSFAADPDRLRRFEQEARAAGRLSHPNILTVHDLGRHMGAPFLVSELLEGQTLRDRLARGALPREEAVDRAAQIARGLAAAHAEGIVHRDLKPENLFVTRDGRLKILDFGLAKLAGPSGGVLAAGGDLSAAPTAIAGTVAGTVLGTLAYMSPEQARGADADARTDVFSFGAVLYEMLSGRPAFERATGADTLAAVLHEEPADLPPRVPEGLRRLVRRCLAKLARDRFTDGADLLAAIEALPKTESGARRSPIQRVAGGVLIAGVAAATAVGLWLRRSLGETPPTTRLEQITMSEATETSPAFSPEGARLLYVVESAGLRHLRLRDLGSGADTAVTAGDYDELQPAWSPDGRTALFVRARQARQRLEPGDIFGAFAGGDVWERDLTSGREARLVENAFNPAVSPDGAHIAVDAAWVGASRIWTVDRQGHNPVQITSDTTEAVTHLRPRWSPDGERLVFKHIERTRFDVRLVDVASKQVTVLTDDVFPDHDPVFAANGRAIYFSSYRSGGLNIWRMPIDGAGRPSGRPQQLTSGAGQDLEPSPSPDGKRLAFSVLRQNASVWRLPIDPVSGRATGDPGQVIATTREDSRGAWSPDGRRIAFNSDRAGAMNIWVYEVDSGQARPLTEGPGGDFQPSWSPDGRRLVFFSSRSGNADIWTVDVESRALRQLTRGRAMEINPFWSPDGRVIAYQSDESGRLEVWVMNADGSEPRALTSVGVVGHFLRFTPDGSEVVFRCPAGGGRTLAVAVAGGEPRALAEVAGGSHMSFDPSGGAIMDVIGHKTLWVSPLAGGGAPAKVFEFPDPSVRIDYPVWSPDGRWVLFDRFLPKGGDVWMMDGLDDR
ncbi:MAG TPA: protein kinase [Patescibacteria group bacterium]|nr:protein kinase [Patescibacteria group bacterium]